MAGLDGFDVFVKKISKLQTDARSKPKEAALKIGAAVERQAKINASTGSHKKGQPHIPGTGPGPNRVTGFLRNSITSSGRPIGFDAYQVVVGPTAPYAKDVEFGVYSWKKKSDGTAFQPGQGYPYFQFAVDGLRRMGAYDTILKQVFEGTGLNPKK
jgi:hypothetical protein